MRKPMLELIMCYVFLKHIIQTKFSNTLIRGGYFEK